MYTMLKYSVAIIPLKSTNISIDIQISLSYIWFLKISNKIIIILPQTQWYTLQYSLLKPSTHKRRTYTHIF